MKLLILIIIIINTTNLFSQEHYFVTAKSGLNVRSNNTLDAKKVAKIPYGVRVEKIADTSKELSINDNGILIKGTWVKIKYNNYFFLVSKETKQFESEGYVFDGYLQKLTLENVIDTTRIKKTHYNKLFKTAYKQQSKPKKIGNLDSIKTILKNRVEWGDDTNEYERDDFIKSITTETGQKLRLNDISNDYGFNKGWSGYYPEYDILLLEGGHSSDMAFSIKTGETDITIGNPEYMIASPKNTYRLNGTYSGQECVLYFFQKKVNGEFTYLTDFFFCLFKEFYWISETKFIYTQLNYQNDAVNGEEEYFMGEIKE